ncbi:P-loop NTPase domain-containing protein LPA1 homolog 2-like [Magnolia sinica]|uniref:P-loop NTPase domain-containing protein LPA1 homolog 2-like n=1 Tax=Magnolia sinica TaxID=86752 RepID=UPI002658BFD0|nr:P-loop NTPase domain-containing protein LPA1 homolog 2-like [Magnolia sinica]XP_058107297.1 P-loop NTPase domain-containing protein LPA1 homolog 2-like [Magnolia sinica]XP_058107298.1 P-loop NTPase domain-containing protein LPA1 homolog 2-like [Magnolia sinica]XP_058107299.1 P-loop NTPase domain-containing protein LPA1 homolog 2-like [Magnolia sinica]
MAGQKLCYVIVVDEEAEKDVAGALCYHPQSNTSFWYTRSILQSVLQLVGCKVNHAFKISRRVFDVLEGESRHFAINFQVKETSASDLDGSACGRQLPIEDIKQSTTRISPKKESDLLTENNDKPFDLYKKQVTVTVTRARFLDAICSSLEEYHYVGPSQRADIYLACRLRERKESVTILLCGTSGCGKSTLSSLLASRLGITTVISTDSIRHMMRSFVDEKENPLLWASTYHAGEFLDPTAVAKAKMKKKAVGSSTSSGNGSFAESAATQERTEATKVDVSNKKDTASNLTIEQVGSKILAIEGYKAQSEMVIESLDRLITNWEDRRESVVVEGVHLSLNFVMGLMKKHPSIIPFLVYIADEEKHMERFAIRAKYMTLDPSKNKYVKYIRNIRAIQDYLCKRAEKHLVPKVNNTNVDRSVASIHSTIFSCLRRRQAGVCLYDTATNTVKALHEEYCKQCDSNSIGSKGMFRMIQRQGSVRRYMAVFNSDGSVAKAWPFSSMDENAEQTSANGIKNAVGSPIYGPLHVEEAEPVNLQFGNFGIGSWPNGTEGTSYTSSLNGSRVEDEEVSRYASSSSSPLHPDGHAKELTDEVAVSESEEEPLQDEDDDSSEATEEREDEFGGEGSVAESSARSDEEYEADQMEEKFDADATRLQSAVSGNPTNLCDCCDRESNSCKYYTGTLSMRPLRKPTRNGGLYRRVWSLPHLRNRLNRNKNMSSPKLSLDVSKDGSS